MAFRKSTNEHDRFAMVVSRHKAALAGTAMDGLPGLSQPQFHDFLTDGTAALPKTGTLALTDLSDQDFLVLEKLVNELQPDMQADLIAFSAERIRRFRRFA
jgi:hypothetical protein